MIKLFLILTTIVTTNAFAQNTNEATPAKPEKAEAVPAICGSVKMPENFYINEGWGRYTITASSGFLDYAPLKTIFSSKSAVFKIDTKWFSSFGVKRELTNIKMIDPSGAVVSVGTQGNLVNGGGIRISIKDCNGQKIGGIIESATESVKDLRVFHLEDGAGKSIGRIEAQNNRFITGYDVRDKEGNKTYSIHQTYLDALIPEVSSSLSYFNWYAEKLSNSEVDPRIYLMFFVFDINNMRVKQSEKANTPTI